MKLEEARQAYYDSSDTLSSIVRNISFAGIAVGWAIIAGEQKSIQYTHSIGIVFLILVGALFFDLLHYIFKAAAWGIYNAIKHAHGVKLSDDINPPTWFNPITIAFFCLKTLLSLVGIIYLGCCLWTHIIRP